MMSKSQRAYARHAAVQEMMEHENARSGLLALSERVSVETFWRRAVLESRAKMLLAEAQYHALVEEYAHMETRTPFPDLSAETPAQPVSEPHQSESQHDD